MKQRILVVEDEPAVARGVKDALSFNGYTVDVAVDGPSGYRLAREHAFDLIVLDLMLPGLDGLEVLGRLRKDGCVAPILILTARGHEGDRVKGLELGADDYVVRPFSAREVVARIRAVLRRTDSPGEAEERPIEIGEVRLDPAKREDMWEVVRGLVDDGSTVLLTTQYLEEADALADEITVIDHGRVIAHDTPDGLKRVVGGQRLTVRPADPRRVAEVAAIVAEVAATEPDSPARGVVSAPVDGDAALTAAVGKLGAAGIAVTELSLHLPSLDEVFFTLTGRRRDGGAEPESEDAA